jgi:hypothetical protein
MGEWCKNCDKIMKDPELTHCSDECLMKHVKKSESGQGGEKSAEYWMEESDPWK